MTNYRIFEPCFQLRQPYSHCQLELCNTVCVFADLLCWIPPLLTFALQLLLRSETLYFAEGCIIADSCTDSSGLMVITSGKVKVDLPMDPEAGSTVAPTSLYVLERGCVEICRFWVRPALVGNKTLFVPGIILETAQLLGTSAGLDPLESTQTLLLSRIVPLLLCQSKIFRLSHYWIRLSHYWISECPVVDAKDLVLNSYGLGTIPAMNVRSLLVAGHSGTNWVLPYSISGESCQGKFQGLPNWLGTVWLWILEWLRKDSRDSKAVIQGIISGNHFFQFSKRFQSWSMAKESIMLILGYI